MTVCVGLNTHGHYKQPLQNQQFSVVDFFFMNFPFTKCRLRALKLMVTSVNSFKDQWVSAGWDYKFENEINLPTRPLSFTKATLASTGKTHLDIYSLEYLFPTIYNKDPPYSASDWFWQWFFFPTPTSKNTMSAMQVSGLLLIRLIKMRIYSSQ